MEQTIKPLAPPARPHRRWLYIWFVPWALGWYVIGGAVFGLQGWAHAIFTLSGVLIWVSLGLLTWSMQRRFL